MPKKCKIHHFHLLKLAYAIMVSLGITLIVAACKPKEIDIPFETIEQKDFPHNGHPYTGNEPTLFLVTQPADVTRLDGWVGDGSQAKLQELDYNQEFALVVLQGDKPTTGYGVQINRITRRGATVNIYAQFKQLDIGASEWMEETSPYHLVKIEKTLRWGQKITFKVIANDKVIISSKTYIP